MGLSLQMLVILTFTLGLEFGAMLWCRGVGSGAAVVVIPDNGFLIEKIKKLLCGKH